MRATAKKRQIIIPAKVRYAGPMISRAGESNRLKKIQVRVQQNFYFYVTF